MAVLDFFNSCTDVPILRAFAHHLNQLLKLYDGQSVSVEMSSNIEQLSIVYTSILQDAGDVRACYINFHSNIVQKTIEA